MISFIINRSIKRKQEYAFYIFSFPFFFFFSGKTKLNNNDTTKTPATAFPLKISPTTDGKHVKKFPEV